MSFLALIVLLIIVGLILPLVEKTTPFDPTVKRILYVVVIIVVFWWLLTALGLLPSIRAMRVP